MSLMDVEDRGRPTAPIYQYDERLREHLTRTTCIRKFSKLWPEEQALFKSGTDQTYVLECAETIFYVQGGGQPCDTGYVTGNKDGKQEQRFDVEAVRYDGGGRVLHFGHFIDDTSPFELGDMVTQHINGARRELDSRNHTAGHLIGLAVRHLAEATPGLEATELKASHYPDAAFVEFKGIIDGKYKEAIQAAASQYVSDALPIKLYWYKPDELSENDVITAEGMPIVSGSDGKVRVVDIVGAGAYPCGGTHVPDTSYVGSITVRNIKRQKGVSKVSYAVSDTQGWDHIDEKDCVALSSRFGTGHESFRICKGCSTIVLNDNHQESVWSHSLPGLGSKIGS